MTPKVPSKNPPDPLHDLIPAPLIPPAYHGGSIANLPAAIGTMLGVTERWAAPALEAAEILGRADRVVLLLVDGVGWNRLSRESGVLMEDPRLRLRARLTSIVPATTSAATTVLLGNGSGPAATGMLGYTFLLPGQGVLANMLTWIPVGREGAVTGEIESWGEPAEEFLPTPSLAQALASGGVRTAAFMPASLTRTPLSRMQLRGAEVGGYFNWTDLYRQLASWSEQASDRSFAYAYIPDFDGLSHRDGPDVPLWSDLWRLLAGDLSVLMERLRSPAKRTLLLVTADHGHVSTPPEARVDIEDHPELFRLSSLGPGGEARHVNLYARGGRKAELLAYCREHLSREFLALDADEALECGLYGPTDRMHPETPARLGDVLLLPRGDRFMWKRGQEVTMRGMHGSLEADEMHVPLLAFLL
jgi:hypothetical protein